MNVHDTLVLLGLPKVGRKTVKKIIDSKKANSPISNLDEYVELVGHVSANIASNLSYKDIEESLRRVDNILTRSDNEFIKPICFDDQEYPELLRHLGPDAPVVLFVKGDVDILHEEKKVAVIGTRKNSTYGWKAGTHITKQFVENGYVIVSGLAIGCDTIAHKACLESGGKTIAVMAGGLDSIYPKENRGLAEEIVDNGCLISEYPIGTRSLANYFVERDRIQSGLSKGVVVIETDVKGGTMHTVKFGMDQGRPVACIKYRNDIVSQSNAGNRMLISRGSAFSLESDNIESYLEKLKGAPYFGLTANNDNKYSKYSPGDAVKNSELNKTKSTAFDSHPELERKKNENKALIAEIDTQINELKKEIKSLGGVVEGQSSMNFDVSSNDLKEIERLEKGIDILKKKRKSIIEDTNRLLDIVKNKNK